MSKPAIQVEALSKQYMLGGGALGGRTLREMLVDTAGALLSRLRVPQPRAAVLGQTSDASSLGTAARDRGTRATGRANTFHALRDVTFTAERGEVIGVIGPNGAGKSTLLKILSGITAPTVGKAVMRGRVASLLEVGTGFHPELTGRENIFLNGAVLGMTRREIKAKFDTIVDFSGVEAFLDTPVKRYSSGMKVRLAFAVAAHLDSEILIVDEVLAVGDAAFQNKCLGKMREVAAGSGRTVLLVSHNMDSIMSLSSRAMLITAGQTEGCMPVEQAVRQYFDAITAGSDQPLLQRERVGRAGAVPRFADLRLTSGESASSVIRCGEKLCVDIELHNMADVSRGECGIVITNQTGQRVAAFQSQYNNNLILTGRDRFHLRCEIPNLYLVPGTYFVDLVLADQPSVIDQVDRAGQFEVVFNDLYGTGKLPNASHGMCVLPADWKVAA